MNYKKYSILELIKMIKNNCKIYRKLITDTEFKLLLEYIFFLFKKNIEIIKEKIIYNEQGIVAPLISLKRGDVVWVDFGYGIGAEFRYFHYAVVLAIEDNQVIVIPLTSRINSHRNSKMALDIGYLNKLYDKNNESKKSYALVKSIRSVSIKRIIRPEKNGKKIRLKLNSEQLNLIDENIKNFLIKS